MQWNDELLGAVKAARAAGKQLLACMGKSQTVLDDSGRDIKLQADRDAEALILDILQPFGHPVLAEERGELGEVMSGNTPYWIVDPLDGTYNYSRVMPGCCVSIALARGMEPLLGVVYDFVRDECFTGVVGEGAWLDDVPVQVAPQKPVAQAMLTTGFSTQGELTEETLNRFVDSARRFKKVRMLGTAALMMAYVANGRADAYAEDHIMWWDVAGGTALVRAAGGHVEFEPSPKHKWALIVRAANNAALWE